MSPRRGRHKRRGREVIQWKARRSWAGIWEAWDWFVLIIILCDGERQEPRILEGNWWHRLNNSGINICTKVKGGQVGSPKIFRNDGELCSLDYIIQKWLHSYGIFNSLLRYNLYAIESTYLKCISHDILRWYIVKYMTKRFKAVGNKDYKMSREAVNWWVFFFFLKCLLPQQPVALPSSHLPPPEVWLCMQVHHMK